MASVNKINLELFKEQVEKFKGNVEKEFDKRRKKFAVAILHKLIFSSPFSTGSYILSHNVGINIPDTSFSSFPHLMQSKATAQAKSLKDGKAKIMASRLFDTIYITNSVPHAVNVEYLGWKVTPPYHVYGLTYEYMRHMVGRYMGK